MSEDEKILKEAKKLSWEERLAHKNWKVRNEANIDLAALCESILDCKDPRFKEFGQFLNLAESERAWASGLRWRSRLIGRPI